MQDEDEEDDEDDDDEKEDEQNLKKMETQRSQGKVRLLRGRPHALNPTSDLGLTSDLCSYSRSQ